MQVKTQKGLPPASPESQDVGMQLRFRTVALILLGIALLAFCVVLLSDLSLSPAGDDFTTYERYMKEFGFGHLYRDGRVPLWNPHLFCGTPFVENIQSGMFYPPSWLYLLSAMDILSLGKVVSLLMLAHVYLIGLFTYLWTFHRRLHPVACLFAAVVMMFSGAFFVRIFAGHTPTIGTVTWAPLMFLAIDHLLERPRLFWLLLGMLSVAMMVLAGHMQYVFYMAMAAGLYSALRLVRAPRRLKSVAMLSLLIVGAIALSSITLLPGISGMMDGVRSGKLDYEIAGSFSLPPANLLSLVAPGFFGFGKYDYWGDWFFWEAIPFFGVVGLAMAICGAIYGDRTKRLFSAPLALLFLVLAMGSYTPIFGLLYKIPPFGQFRCNNRFLFEFTLFAVMLAAIGMDVLIRTRRVRWPIAIGALVLGLAAAVMGLAILGSASVIDKGTGWFNFVNWVVQKKEFCHIPEFYQNPSILSQMGIFAAKALGVASVTLLVVATLVFLSRYSRWCALALAILGMAEVFAFAKSFPNIAKYEFNNDVNGMCQDLSLLSRPVDELKTVYRTTPGDYRIYMGNESLINSALAVGWGDIWGYDPLKPRRYAEYMALTQGYKPQDMGNPACSPRNLQVHSFPMLRLKLAFVPRQEGGIGLFALPGKPLDHVMLMQDYRVLPQQQVLERMNDPQWDPWRTVLLEAEPNPAPVKTLVPQTAKIVRSGTDYLEIEADLKEPAILLVTDSYTSKWRAVPLEGSSQQSYQVMPANYVLRAVPLAAGHHHLRMEYHLLVYQVGKWISLLSLLAWACLMGWDIRRTARARRAGASSSPADKPAKAHPAKAS